MQAALATVNDPEIRRPITDLDMVKSVDIEPDGVVRVGIFLTVAGCPLRDKITRDVTAAVSKLDGVTSVSVDLDVMSQEQRQQLQIRGQHVDMQRRVGGRPALQPDVMERDVARREHRNVDRSLDDEIEPGDGADLRLDRLLVIVSGAFDLAWCRLAIGHVAELETVYAELARISGPGAAVIVTDFHAAAHAAGHRRTFRVDGEVHEAVHHVHPAEVQIDAARRAGLALRARSEAAIGPEVRGYYEAAGRPTLYREHCGLPVVLALAYDSRTKGNVATEIVKYYMQLHFGIKKDYRLPQLLKRGNFYQSN